MASVTQRIKEVKQPYGGYLKPRLFQKEACTDDIVLYPEENISPGLVGIAVDYLTRFMMTHSAQDAFSISLTGAILIGQQQQAARLLDEIRGLDDQSITCACKLAGYDVCFRAGIAGYRPVEGILPDADTIFNIKTMVRRSLSFWKAHGPLIKSGFTFEGGYTETVDSGDGDYLTENILWDFKVSKNPPNTKQTLQLLMYYIMGCHSVHSEYQSIQYLGIFNPRLNLIYTYPVKEISPEVIQEVEANVICYSGVSARVPAASEAPVPKRPAAPKAKAAPSSSSDSFWTLQDLCARYGVGRAKITGDFFACGLPYSKESRRYCFDPNRVMQWEIRQRSIPYKKNQKLVLPAHTAFGESLRQQLKQARQAKDKEQIKSVKKLLKENGFTPSWMKIFAQAVLWLAIIGLTLLYSYPYYQQYL